MGDEWDWVKGTFMTIDRPYGPVLDFLHHRIGSTHVAHHVAHTIPHYHAKEATEALATAFPHIYLYDPTPLHQALWRLVEGGGVIEVDVGEGRRKCFGRFLGMVVRDGVRHMVRHVRRADAVVQEVEHGPV